jgi:hypothetical protein
MEKRFNEKEVIESSRVLDIVANYKDKTNKDLEIALEFINVEFEKTKDNLLKLTDHLDKLELTYNTLLKEYKSRNVR